MQFFFFGPISDFIILLFFIVNLMNLLKTETDQKLKNIN